MAPRAPGFLIKGYSQSYWCGLRDVFIELTYMSQISPSGRSRRAVPVRARVYTSTGVCDHVHCSVRMRGSPPCTAAAESTVVNGR